MQKSYKIYSNSSHFHLNTHNILFCFYHCEVSLIQLSALRPLHCCRHTHLEFKPGNGEVEVAFPLDRATCTVLCLLTADADNQTIRRYVARVEGEILIAINSFIFWHTQHTDNLVFYY